MVQTGQSGYRIIQEAPVLTTTDRNGYETRTLATELQTTPRKLREFLRNRFPRPLDLKGTRYFWASDDPQLGAIRAAWRA